MLGARQKETQMEDRVVTVETHDPLKVETPVRQEMERTAVSSRKEKGATAVWRLLGVKQPLETVVMEE